MILRTWLSAAALLTVAACGGGSIGSKDGGTPPPPPPPPPTAAEASRFLAQASFGPSQGAIDALTASSIPAWIEAEFAKPASSHLAYVDARAATLASGEKLGSSHVLEAWWKIAVTGNDALRQRVAFSLSQIFVVSFDSNLSDRPRAVASYYDMLGRNAFGNFRTLIEDVSLHPAMGIYLSHLRNQKENPAKGRVPDENYAREVMQLFTIGLYQLNPDGTPVLQGGQAVETYTNEDVSGLARVFTGWSWGGPDTGDGRFWEWSGSEYRDPNRETLPMQGYSQFHSISEKRFLGLSIPAQGTANPNASLKAALDHLFAHPNVGPFFCKQLIQRLVVSNPSPAYVGRCAAAFANNGSGVRGDMKAVIRSVLLDSDARDASTRTGDSVGRQREPILRLTHWLRAFNAGSDSGRWLVGNTDSSTSSLGQSPLRSPSVFNYYRPGYVPPGTLIAQRGLVAPEMQITNETSVAGYLNAMQDWIGNGVGSRPTGATRRDVQQNFAAELALADQPAALVARVELLLAHNAWTATTRQTIVDAVTSVPIPATDQAKIDAARLNRVRLAVFLAMATPETLTLK